MQSSRQISPREHLLGAGALGRFEFLEQLLDLAMVGFQQGDGVWIDGFGYEASAYFEVV
jgi:hypothetical protein